MLDPCTIDPSRLPVLRHRCWPRIASHDLIPADRVQRRAPAPGMPANAGLSNACERVCDE
jgi:hypothetical protein